MENSISKKLWLLYRNMEFKKVIKIGEAALRRAQNHNIETIKVLGIAYDQLALQIKNKEQRLRFQEKAVKYFMQILNINQKSVDAYRGLGLVSLHQNKFKESLRYYKKAYFVNKKDMSNFISIANVYRAIGKYGLALRWYKKCLSSKQTNEKIIALLNVSLMFADQIGNKKIAKKYAMQTLKLIQKHRQDRWADSFVDKLEYIIKN